MVMKVRVEVMDEEGTKTSIEREGDSLNESFKPSTIRSIVTFLEEQLPSPSLCDPSGVDREDLTIKERLAYFLRYDKRAPTDWFTSSQVMQIYKEAYGEEISISTLSTYLANMYSEGILMRKGSRAKRQYRLAKKMRPADSDAAVHVDDMEMIEYLPLQELLSGQPRV
jgi:hypothetical protein